jgi:hypothetical protein
VNVFLTVESSGYEELVAAVDDGDRFLLVIFLYKDEIL